MLTRCFSAAVEFLVMTHYIQQKWDGYFWTTLAVRAA